MVYAGHYAARSAGAANVSDTAAALERHGLAPVCDPAASIYILTGDAWADVLSAALREARDSVRLSAYMIGAAWAAGRRWRLDLLGDLCDVAARNVEARAVLATHGPGAAGTYNRAAAARLARAGWRLRAAASGPGVHHEKLLIIDRKMVFIGSHNLARAAAAQNNDTSLMIESPHLAAAVGALWLSRWRDGTGDDGAQ